MLISILLVGIIFRLIISPFLNYHTDLNYWVLWSVRLNNLGFANFYDNWSDYLPSYLYVLSFLGKLKEIFGLGNGNVLTGLIYKTPAILADIGTGLLIYIICRRWKLTKNVSLITTTIYLFNPAIFANSALWGQIDGFLPFLFLLTLLFLFNQKIIIAGLVFAYLLLFKLQSIFWTPILILYLKSKTLIFLASVVIASVFISLPFINQPPLNFINNRLFDTVGHYPYASLNAYNLWAVFFLQSRSDQIKFINIPLQWWGIIIFSIISLLIIKNYFQLRKILGEERSTIFSAALVMGATFLFLTRAHERHILPFIALLTIFLPYFNKRGFFVYFSFSFVSVLNLFTSYAWMEWRLLIMYNFLPFMFSIVNLLLYFSILFYSRSFVIVKGKTGNGSGR